MPFKIHFYNIHAFVILFYIYSIDKYLTVNGLKTVVFLEG